LASLLRQLRRFSRDGGDTAEFQEFEHPNVQAPPWKAQHGVAGHQRQITSRVLLQLLDASGCSKGFEEHGAGP
jgi:hypothetical protein